MKKKKGIIITIITIGVLLLLLVLFIILKQYTHLFAKNIEVSHWNDQHILYSVCKSNTFGEVVQNASECHTSFRTKDSLSTLIDSNKDAYLGEITFIDDGLEYPGSLFYYNNNYYALYYTKYHDYYHIQNCYLNYGIFEPFIYVPCPVYVHISDEIMRMDREDYQRNTLDFLFDNYTFQQAKEFYDRISEDYVQIDSETQQITVDGYNPLTKESIRQCIIFDFKHRTLSGKDDKGNYVTITGLETVNP